MPLVVAMTVLVGSLWVELALGLYGCFFAATLFLFPNTKHHRNWYVALLFVVVIVADLAFQRHLGTTALVMGVVLSIWNGVRRLSRWRFFAYLGLGGLASLLLSGYKEHLVTVGTILIFLWSFVRLITIATRPTEIRAE